MKGIVKFGLVMSVLFCGAIGAASAQEDVSEDYKQGYMDGFYEGAMLMVGGARELDYLAGLYYNLGGEPTEETTVVDNETMTWSDYYNQQATIYNEETVPYINGIILQIFGTEDNRTELLLLPEIDLIS